ncbi:hypothetical protein L596_013676 [Steinernema carpocapsae]|uniref:Uncharacterized protein n=1 Tax=Steinernema carpocapsae TaxID=34508 RepID=A0A4U5P0V8_STECR|nr:hypothetical protein L596_013676 [Steinernema carpocapsae]
MKLSIIDAAIQKPPDDNDKNRLRNPQTAQKSSYRARVAEVVAELCKVALKSSATALSIQMVSPEGVQTRVDGRGLATGDKPRRQRHEPVAVAHKITKS